MCAGKISKRKQHPVNSPEVEEAVSKYIGTCEAQMRHLRGYLVFSRNEVESDVAFMVYQARMEMELAFTEFEFTVKSL